MLKEGDGCDPVVSHVPCGVLEGWQRLSLSLFPPRSLFLSSPLHSCPLLSFNIWSLFSIINARALTMTLLLKMPRMRTFQRVKGTNSPTGMSVCKKLSTIIVKSPFLWFYTIYVLICPHCSTDISTLTSNC